LLHCITTEIIFIPTNGKAIPIEAGTGLEGSRRLRLPDLKKMGT
jgi:hypothetical protein